MEFKEYLAIIRRRWLLFFPIFLLIVAGHLIWVSYGQDNRYSATSKIIIGGPVTQAGGHLPMPLQGLSAVTKQATLTDYPVLRRAAQLAVGVHQFESAAFEDSKLADRIQASQTQLRATYGESEPAVENLVGRLRGSVRLFGESLVAGRKPKRKVTQSRSVFCTR